MNAYTYVCIAIAIVYSFEYSYAHELALCGYFKSQIAS